jgi:hypothetical protein
MQTNRGKENAIPPFLAWGWDRCQGEFLYPVHVLSPYGIYLHPLGEVEDMYLCIGSRQNILAKYKWIHIG